jgi:DNA invertase Pin-like site-specific DNA recombinase
MLEDCRAGSIDMIITKSITRFARNTVTLLETVRELKSLGIDVFFEKENILTLSADGEFMITLLASYAQEESRSVSENQKWRIRKMFEKGRPNTGRMLGYRLRDGKLQIVPEEAEIVRRIFSEYLSGKGKLAIAKSLNADGIGTINGGRWRESVIHKILQNEKYTGDLLLQKTYVADPITKKGRINKGEKRMYQVSDSHEAIISKEMFAEVGREITRRAATHKNKVSPANPEYPFTGLIHCDICGSKYKRKHTAIGTKYDRIAWSCNTFNSLGKDVCNSKRIPEDILMIKAAEVLGLTEFDETVLSEKIARIHVVSHNLLRFVFRDGRTVDTEWENLSRRHSWTPEMKQKARERQMEVIKRRSEP